MKKILIGTTNPGKLKEYKEILSELPIEVLTTADFPELPPVHETGKTFDENALLKATQYSTLTGLPTIVDDGGFEIDILHGEPGVISHRWIDGVNEASDEELIEYTLTRLDGVPEDKRTARLTLTMIFDDGQNVHMAHSSIEGRVVTEKPTFHREGLPYRALLYIPKYDKLFDELTEEEHKAINHRRAALRELLPKIEESLDLK